MRAKRVGRPTLEVARTRVLYVRLTEEEHALFEKARKDRGLRSVGEYARISLIEIAKK